MRCQILAALLTATVALASTIETGKNDVDTFGFTQADRQKPDGMYEDEAVEQMEAFYGNHPAPIPIHSTKRDDLLSGLGLELERGIRESHLRDRDGPFSYAVEDLKPEKGTHRSDDGPIALLDAFSKPIRPSNNLGRPHSETVPGSGQAPKRDVGPTDLSGGLDPSEQGKDDPKSEKGGSWSGNVPDKDCSRPYWPHHKFGTARNEIPRAGVERALDISTLLDGDILGGKGGDGGLLGGVGGLLGDEGRHLGDDGILNLLNDSSDEDGIDGLAVKGNAFGGGGYSGAAGTSADGKVLTSVIGKVYVSRKYPDLRPRRKCRTALSAQKRQ